AGALVGQTRSEGARNQTTGRVTWSAGTDPELLGTSSESLNQSGRLCRALRLEVGLPLVQMLLDELGAARVQAGR
ncbi:MAG: hypothetical protein ACE5MI_11700, partial [Acidimicrobiia bacterium]